MHRQHRTCKLKHFYYLGPNFRFLADATGRRFPKTDSFHNSGQRSIPLDHFTHGTFGLPRKLPTTDGRGTKGHSQCTSLHRRSPLHTDMHEKHLQVLDQVLARLHKNHLKINLEKCVFGNKEVSYLGFTLIPDGIKPGKNKLKAIKDARPPTDIKTIRSFVGLCNFFRTLIKDFALIAAPLFNAAQLGLLMLKEESECEYSDFETIDSLCSGPCPSCDTENDYFKLNPPKRNFTQKCNNCEEFKKLFLKLKEREEQCYQFKTAN
jgi:hypothetical protein